MKKIFTLLLIFLLTISFLLFHDKGNQFISPYFANYLEGKVGVGTQIEIQHLKIDANHIEFDALVNESVKIEAEGELSLLTQNLDLIYTLKSDSLKNRVEVNGTVIGSFSNMYIAGAGEIFKSTIDYRLYRKEGVLHGVQLKIENADIASVLLFSSQKVYAKGRVDVNVTIPNLEKTSTKNNVKMRLHETRLNPKVFKKVWGIDVEYNTVVTASINAKVCNKYAQLEGFVKSDFATLNFSKAHYDMGTKELSSDYGLLVPKLVKLTNEREKKFRGSLEVEGRFKSKDSKIYLTGNSPSLGGKIVFNLHDNRLEAHMNGVDIEKLSYLLGEKRYVGGELMADVELRDVTQQKGVFSFTTKEAKTVDATLKEAFNVNFEKSLPLVIKGQGTIEGKRVIMKNSIDTDIFQAKSSDIYYNLSTKVLKSHYAFHVPKLSKLNSVTGKNLKGELTVRGKVNYDNEMIATGRSHDLGGAIDFTFKAQKLKMQLNNVSVEKLSDTFSYAKLFKAKLFGNLDYDVAKHSGKFTSKLSEAKLVNSSLIKTIEKIKGSKIDTQRYEPITFNATFHHALIDVNFKAQSKRVLLSIPNGTLNPAENKIDASYKVKVDDVELEGKLIGALSHPEITFNSSKYIENNVMSVIEDAIPSPAVRGFKIGKKNHDTMKNMMFDFFK